MCYMSHLVPLRFFSLVFPYPFSQQTNRSEQFLFRVPNRMFDASKNIYFNFNHKPAVNVFLPVTSCSSFHWTFNFQTYSQTHTDTHFHRSLFLKWNYYTENGTQEITNLSTKVSHSIPIWSGFRFRSINIMYIYLLQWAEVLLYSG